MQLCLIQVHRMENTSHVDMLRRKSFYYTILYVCFCTNVYEVKNLICKVFNQSFSIFCWKIGYEYINSQILKILMFFCHFNG